MPDIKCMKTLQQVQEELGKKLKDVREKQNFTQADVATRAEISIGYYARIERGEENPTLDILYRLQKALRIKIQYVFPD